MDARILAAEWPLTRLPSPLPTVALWQLDLKDLAEIGEMAVACLSPEERARHAALRHPGDQLRYAATRTALRCLLARRLQCEPASLCLVSGAHGKPALAMVGAPAFNVSHAGDHAWIAIADRDADRDAGVGAEVGVDIERIDATLTQAALRNMAAHCLTARECAWLEAQPADAWPRAFFTLWTAKEALLKALGIGIADHLQHVSVIIRAAGDARHAVVPESGLPAAYAAALARTRLYALAAPDGYAAAMAWLPPA